MQRVLEMTKKKMKKKFLTKMKYNKLKIVMKTFQEITKIMVLIAII